VTLLNVHILSSGSTQERAIILMADGLILFWVILGGSLTPWLRRWLVPRLITIPIGWRVRFVLLCTAMALLEEVITTSMTNLAPLLGTTPEEAHITGSTNYLVVVCFHSVVVFVPMFAAWAWMLSRWDFSPLKVLLLFGITGSIAEASMNPANLIGGFWVFVYGLDRVLARLHGAGGSRCETGQVVALPAGRDSAAAGRCAGCPRGHSCATMAGNRTVVWCVNAVIQVGTIVRPNIVQDTHDAFASSWRDYNTRYRRTMGGVWRCLLSQNDARLRCAQATWLPRRLRDH
jgi:hypothetical protein